MDDKVKQMDRALPHRRLQLWQSAATPFCWPRRCSLFYARIWPLRAFMFSGCNAEFTKDWSGGMVLVILCLHPRNRNNSGGNE